MTTPPTERVSTQRRLARGAADAVVCDALLPWTSAFLPAGADLVTTLGEFHAAGVDHVSVTVAAGGDDTVAALCRIGELRRVLSCGFAFVQQPAEILAAHRRGVMSVAFNFQTTTPFSSNLDLVDAFKAAGISRALLAYNGASLAGDGCHESRNGGLTGFGRALVVRMLDVGMAVDLSHCGERTALEAMDLMSEAPLFSHSNARALFDHERNLSDEVIRDCGRRGGFIGINGVGMFLGEAGQDIVDLMARHAAHVAALAGAHTVGLGLDHMVLEGSDYAFFHRSRATWPRGYPPPPWEFLQPVQLSKLVPALEKQGFSTAELRGILGENYLRVLTHQTQAGSKPQLADVPR